MTLLSCTSCRVTIPVLFASVKPETRCSFRKKLQPHTLSQIITKSISTTHCHLPFFILLTPVSCDGSNRLSILAYLSATFLIEFPPPHTHTHIHINLCRKTYPIPFSKLHTQCLKSYNPTPYVFFSKLR